MNVLSLFDGISAAQQAFKNLGIEFDGVNNSYYASEIDVHAINATRHNFPNTIQMGDIRDVSYSANKHIHYYYRGIRYEVKVEKIDLLIFGSPCQDLSCAKRNRQGLKGTRSRLFFEALRILRKVKPRYFVMENVASMTKEDCSEISSQLGLREIRINSSLLTAQNRNRLYWIGLLQPDGGYKAVEILQPTDKGILLQDILENSVHKKYFLCLSQAYYQPISYNFEQGKFSFADKPNDFVFTFNNGKNIEINTSIPLCTFTEVRTDEGKRKRREHRKMTGQDSTKRGKNDKKYIPVSSGKANCLLTTMGAESLIGYKHPKTGEYIIRKLTPLECERLQGFNDDYLSILNNTQRYKALGNSFTVPVIEHILKNIFKI